MTKAERDIEIDSKLKQMVLESKPESTFTYQEIGEGCGLSHERIRQIEQSGLQKVASIWSKIAEADGIDVKDVIHVR